MAEFDFWGTWEDSRIYLERLAQLRQFVFVVNKAYEELIPLQFTALTDETWAIVQQRPYLYLRSEEYSKFAPSFNEPIKGSVWIFSVRSGPALELSLPYCAEQEGKWCIGSGDVMYQPLYHNPETGEWFKPTESLKRAFSQVRALLRQSMVKRFVRVRIASNGIIRPEIMPVWIGRNAMAALEAGTAWLCLAREFKTAADLGKTPDELPPPADEDE
jgi:hypothetical protein